MLGVASGPGQFANEHFKKYGGLNGIA